MNVKERAFQLEKDRFGRGRTSTAEDGLLESRRCSRWIYSSSCMYCSRAGVELERAGARTLEQAKIYGHAEGNGGIHEGSD